MTRTWILLAMIVMLLPAEASARSERYRSSGEHAGEMEQKEEVSPQGGALPSPSLPASGGGTVEAAPASQIYTWEDRKVIYATNDLRNVPPRFSKRLEPVDPKQMVVRMRADSQPSTPPPKRKKKTPKASRRLD